MSVLHRLAGLKILVDLKEMSDLTLVELWNMPDVTDMFIPRVMRRDAHNLLVGSLFVGHTKHPDSADPNLTARKRRGSHEYQRV